MDLHQASSQQAATRVVIGPSPPYLAGQAQYCHCGHKGSCGSAPCEGWSYQGSGSRCRYPEFLGSDGCGDNIAEEQLDFRMTQSLCHRQGRPAKSETVLQTIFLKLIVSAFFCVKCIFLCECISCVFLQFPYKNIGTNSVTHLYLLLFASCLTLTNKGKY